MVLKIPEMRQRMDWDIDTQRAKGIMANAFANNSALQELYEFMHIDLFILGLNRLRKNSLSGMSPILINKENIPRKIIKFQEELIQNLDYYCLVEAILDSLFTGFKVIEFILDYDKDKKVLPKEIRIHENKCFEYINKKRESYSFFDYDLVLRGTTGYQDLPINVMKVLPKSKSFGLYYNVIPYFVIKYFNMIDWAVFNEIYGLPLTDIGYDKNRITTEDMRDELLDSIINGMKNRVTFHSNDAEIKTEFPSSTSVQGYQSLDDKLESAISFAIIGQVITSDVLSSIGAVSKVQAQNFIRDDIITADVTFVSEWLTKIHQFLVNVNFGDVKIAEVYLDNPKEELKTIIRDKEMLSLGIKFNKKYIVDTYKLNDEDFEMTEEKETVINGVDEADQDEDQREDQDEKNREKTERYREKLDGNKGEYRKAEKSS